MKPWKNALAKFSEEMGITGLLGKVLRPKENKAAILAYHRIADDGETGIPALPVQMFYRQVLWLKRNCDVVSLQQLVEDLTAGRELSGKVVLTFDDGYSDFFTVAFPILHALGLPATVFVVTDFLDGRVPWYDEIHFLLSQTPLKAFDFRLNGRVERYTLENAAQKTEVYRKIKSVLGGLSPDDRQIFLQRLRAALSMEGSGPLNGLTMNWRQLDLVRRAGVDVGGHTVSHPRLSALSLSAVRQEVQGCKIQLERALDQPVRHFCYPTGKSDDYSVEVKRVVREAGYAAACSSEVGYVQPGDDPYELRRLYTTEPYFAKFAWRLPL